jgi:hypothetical protein
LTLTELMEEIQERYQHSLSNASVIRKIDALQKRVFRQYKKQVTTNILSAPGQVFYEIPVRPGDIREFLVDGKSFPYLDIEDEPLPYYFYYNDGKYGIVPSQQANTKITIFHYKTPETLTTSSTGVEIDEEYQNILIYGVCKEIAEIYQDFDLANGYAQQYNFYLEELLTYSKPMESATIKEEWWG